MTKATTNRTTDQSSTGATGAVGPSYGLDMARRFTNPEILWGIGDEIGVVPNEAIYQAAPMNMVAEWFNGPNNLGWMGGYSNPSNTQVNDFVAAGKALQLIVWPCDGTDDRPPHESSSSGQPLPQYDLGEQFLVDLDTLVDMFKGHGPNYGPLYVVLFTEFQNTYWETWNRSGGNPYPSTAAYEADLMHQYVRAAERIRARYDQAKVALGFAGYAWPNEGSTIDLSPYQAAIEASDFMAVQQMQSCLHVDQMPGKLRAAVKQLGTYDKPVMISHMKIWREGSDPNCALDAMARFQAEFFTDDALAELNDWGLWAWNMMDDEFINAPGPQFDASVDFITAHAATPPCLRHH